MRASPSPSVSGTAVRAVLLDADGVLQVNPPGWLDTLRSLVPAGSGERFTEHLFEAEQAALTGHRSFRDVVAEVLEHWGVPERAEDLVAHYHHIEVVSDTAEVARDLRAAGVPVHLATNQHDLRTAYMRDELGYGDLLDSTFSSCELGVTKSDPDFFVRVVERLGLEPAAVLHVDDKDHYVEAAREAGLRGVVWTVDDGPDALRSALREHGLPI
ncbi:HAD family hydrolase [Nocardioides marmotae]|uniref:HAD family hydrolase n=1 Tax=Nocardioides marmotae TaxID=2663857 RepID=UPI0012B5ECA5|nr:HAD-IA family hydrolase [Nocardioides marmotae]MBC9734592.1 HAD-IA family hydrolase [Nocardioides marmotae]MTB85693.1 HAD-IA family hydrolase [Nocardioides marmotae]